MAKGLEAPFGLLWLPKPSGGFPHIGAPRSRTGYASDISDHGCGFLHVQKFLLLVQGW